MSKAFLCVDSGIVYLVTQRLLKIASRDDCFDTYDRATGMNVEVGTLNCQLYQ